MSDLAVRNPDAADTLRGLESAGRLPEGTLHPLGLTLLDTDMSFDEWHAIGVRLTTARNWTSWALGDWWNWGTGLFGEDDASSAVAGEVDRMQALLDQVDLDPDTIKGYARVCEAIAVSRRRADLKFRHHHAVYKLEPAEQEEWLQRASDNRWTSQRLREEMRALKAGDSTVLPAGDDDGSGGGEAGPSRLDRAIEIINLSKQAARPNGFGQYEVPEEVVSQWDAFLGNA